MKNTTLKLVLRKATVRVLSGKALTHVIGGQETDAYPQTGDKQCLTVAAYPQTGDRQCLG